jgi:NAD+ synthase
MLSTEGLKCVGGNKLADQTAIIEELGVAARFDAATEVRRRVDFLKEYLSEKSLRYYVLGISGGVDSLTAGLLAQQAVRELRELGVVQAEFVAVRLPYGSQADETDAQDALATINPDRTYTVNIKPATDAMMSAILAGDPDVVDDARLDFVLGNVKARQRMIAQYTLAGALGGLVIGTDHAAEAVMGFYTKFGDGRHPAPFRLEQAQRQSVSRDARRSRRFGEQGSYGRSRDEPATSP